MLDITGPLKTGVSVSCFARSRRCQQVNRNKRLLFGLSHPSWMFDIQRIENFTTKELLQSSLLVINNGIYLSVETQRQCTPQQSVSIANRSIRVPEM